jgi:hypothetical protein
LFFSFLINTLFEGIVGLFEYHQSVKDSIWTREFEVRFKEKYNSECFQNRDLAFTAVLPGYLLLLQHLVVSNGC